MLPARLLAAERKPHPRVAVTATAAAAAKAMVRGELMLANVGPAGRADNDLSRLRHTMALHGGHHPPGTHRRRPRDPAPDRPVRHRTAPAVQGDRRALRRRPGLL